jgi:hypothetical protein
MAFIDGETYAIVSLVDLADTLHHDDWLASENAFVDSLLKAQSGE